MPVYFIRTKDNKTIADIDCTTKDIHCCINILNYSKELIRQNLNQEFINDIDRVSEIRGEYWEQVGPNKKSTIEIAKHICEEISEKYGLMIVTD